MVKTLICGDVTNDSWSLLVARLEELQFSNHGPFDILILSQQLSITYDVVSSTFERLEKLQMHVYAFSPVDENIWPSFWTVQRKSAGIFNAYKNLTIAYLFNDLSVEQDGEIMSAINGVGYRGCDFLITNKWPSDSCRNLNTNDNQDFGNTGLSKCSSSIAAATFASNVRPRYHIVGGLGVFYQRPPYINHSLENKPQLFTRLIAIDSVSSSKEKSRKWLHALSLNPIIHMKVAELEESPAEFTENPYQSFVRRPYTDLCAEQPNKRFRHLEGKSSSNSFFFDGTTSNSSSIQLNTKGGEDSKTLFIGGLARDCTEKDLKQILPNVVNVRRVAGKSYAFAEFLDHSAAERVFTNANKGYGLILHSRKLSVGWSSSQQERPITVDASPKFDFEMAMKERELIPPNEDARILFVGNVPNIMDVEPKLKALFEGITSIKCGKLFAFVEFYSYEQAMAVITKSINERIVLDGNPLVIGWAKVPRLAQPHPIDCKVLFIGNIPKEATDKDVESICDGWISVRRPAGRDYAFIEFRSPEEAIEWSQKLISSNILLKGSLLQVGWAKGKAADKLDQGSDCWFCLASPSIKIHLIVSVGNFNYLAIPRGGIVERHVLISPIDCVPSRIFLSTESRQEQEKFCKSVEEMFLAEHCGTLLFERALRTKNSRDHMQIHLVPIPLKKISTNIFVFNNLGTHHNIAFHEIENEKSVEEVVLTMEGGPYQEYFYIEIPFDAENPLLKRRFIYVHQNTNNRFPMFFGSEVAAHMLGNPQRANWKNCIVSEEEEIKLVEEIREAFIPYDFTSSN